MTKPLPKWVQKRYGLLWSIFHENSFTLEQAKKVIDSSGVNMFFSELRKSDWVTVTLDKQDNRKRIYTLLPPNRGFEELE